MAREMCWKMRLEREISLTVRLYQAVADAVPFAWSALSSRPKSIPFHDNFLNAAVLPMSPSSGLKQSLVLDMTHLVSLIPTCLSNGSSATLGHDSITRVQH